MKTLTLMTLVIGTVLPLAAGQLRIIGYRNIFTPAPIRRVFYQECNGDPVNVYTHPDFLLQNCQPALDYQMASPPMTPICGGIQQATNVCTFHVCDVFDFGTWYFFIQNPGGAFCDQNFDRTQFTAGSPSVVCCP